MAGAAASRWHGSALLGANTAAAAAATAAAAAAFQKRAPVVAAAATAAAAAEEDEDEDEDDEEEEEKVEEKEKGARVTADLGHLVAAALLCAAPSAPGRGPEDRRRREPAGDVEESVLSVTLRSSSIAGAWRWGEEGGVEPAGRRGEREREEPPSKDRSVLFCDSLALLGLHFDMTCTVMYMYVCDMLSTGVPGTVLYGYCTRYIRRLLYSTGTVL